MPSCRHVLATLLTAATAAAQAAEATPARIATELRAGDTFVFTVSVESSSKFDDSRKDVAMSTCMTFTASVGARAADATQVECRLDRLRLRATAPNVRTEYDSSSPLPDSGPLQKLRELTGATFLLRIADDGEVTEVKKPAMLDKAAEDSLGTDFRTLFSTWFVALPSEPKSPGSSWEGTTRLFGVAPGEKQTVANYRLASADQAQAVVTARYAPPAPASRPGVQFELRESEGSITIDLEQKRIVRTEARLLARASRTKGTETAISSIVMRAATGDADPSQPPADTKATEAPKPQR